MAVHLDRAERPGFADDRRDDQVPDPCLGGTGVHLLVMLEVARKIVAGGDHPALRDCRARQTLADHHRALAQGRSLVLRQAGIECPFQPLGHRVELVDDRAVGAKEALRLVDDVLEQVARLADRGDPGSDLTERLLGLGAPGDDIARSRQLLDLTGVPDRDRGLGGERREHLGIRVVVGGGLAGHGRQCPEGTGVAGQRDPDHRPDPGIGDELAGRVVPLESLVGEVVVGPDRTLLGIGGAGDRLARLQAARPGPFGDGGHRVAGRVRPAQGVDLGVVQVDPGTVRLEEAGRLLDDLLEDLGRVEDGRHAGGDLAQCPLRVGPPRDLGVGPLELEDQPRVGDGDRGLVGESQQERPVVGVEGVGPVAVDGDRADDDVAVDHRGGDDREDADLAHELVAFRGVSETIVREVIAGPFDALGPDGQAGDPRVRGELGLVEEVCVGPGPQPDPVGRPHLGRPRRSEQVDHRPDRPEQADRGIDHRLEDLVLVAHRADPGGDLAQGPLSVGGPREIGPRGRQLVDETGVGHGDGGLAGQRADESPVGRGERRRLLRIDLDHAERA